jgi:HD domain
MIGSMAWMAKRRGNLSRAESIRLLATIIGLQLKARFRGGEPIAQHLAAIDVVLPDTTLVTQAIEECAEACSPSVFHHSCRTFYWSAYLAMVNAVSFDAEELALAALLHDLELGKGERRSTMGCHCFAGASAYVASSWLEARNVAPASREAITQAIAIHLNPGVPLSMGATPHLLNMGAMADVVGTRAALISKAEQKRVLEMHPRFGFKREMIGHMRREAEFAPRSRAGFLMSLRFDKMIDSAPFEE